MNCTVCGRPSETTAQFCSSCGTALTGPRMPVRFEPHTSRLVRPRERRMIAGVCAGFAEAYGWDVTIVRLLAALSVLFAGLPLLAYLVAWVVMPNAQYALPAQAGTGPGTGPGSMAL